MKRLSLVLSLFLAIIAFPALAQSAAEPVISSIDPRVGSADGGTIVTIRGANFGLPPGFACILPCPPRVFFGGVESTTLEERDTLMIVRTPAHEPRTVEVELRTGDGRSVVVPGGFTFTAPTSPGYDALLLPVYLDGIVQGANGSRFKTEFWIRNVGSAAVQLAPWVCPAGEACGAVFPLTRTLTPGETIRNLPAFFRPPTENTGRLLYVTSEGAGQVATSLRLSEESRAALDAGTEIPVVRQEDFLTSTAYLTSVPLNGAFRLTLRVYEMAQTAARFQVRIYEQAEGINAQLPLREIELSATTIETGPFRSAPAYAQYSDIDTLLLNPVPRPGLLRVEIEPLTAGSVFWTLISATNNDTQRITLVTPQ